MKTFTISRISTLYVILIVVLLIFVSAYNNVASRNMEKESNAIVNEAIPILTTANSLLTNLINQETGLRGYQLAGNIVDIHLEGEKTGWDFIADLYKHPVHAQTPVIVSTALDPPHDYHEKDIEKYLKKPFTMERLLQVPKRLLDNKSSLAYVFPAQNKETLSTTLQRNGINVLKMQETQDMIEVDLIKPPSEKLMVINAFVHQGRGRHLFWEREILLLLLR